MVIFHSFLYVYQRVNIHWTLPIDSWWEVRKRWAPPATCWNSRGFGPRHRSWHRHVDESNGSSNGGFNQPMLFFLMMGWWNHGIDGINGLYLSMVNQPMGDLSWFMGYTGIDDGFMPSIQWIDPWPSLWVCNRTEWTIPSGYVKIAIENVPFIVDLPI